MAKTDVGFAVLTKPHYAIDLCSSPHHHGHHHLTPRPTLDGLISTFVSPSSSSSAPPLPVLCSAVSLSKDGHASKSLYPLRYVQTSTILSVYSLYSLVNPVVLSCLLQCCGGDCYSKCCSVSLPAWLHCVVLGCALSAFYSKQTRTETPKYFMGNIH